MKPGLAVLPLEVWTDVFVYPWISRQEMAQIVAQIGDRKFAEKLQFRLHDYGKQSLRFLDISFKQECIFMYQSRKRKFPKTKASLTVAPFGERFIDNVVWDRIYKDCEFPQIEMPENITKFKQLSIRYLDDEVLAFLDKLKPLFTNVYLDLDLEDSEENIRIFFTHFLPMLGRIRGILFGGILCPIDCLGFFQRHFPGTLSMTKELKLSAITEFIPSYLDWLCAPLDFDLHGPRYWRTCAFPETTVALVYAVRKQFLAATTPSAAFVILVDHMTPQQQQEFTLENAVTNEQLVVRNACFKGVIDPECVEILRYPTGADAKMGEWIEQRAFYEKFKKNYDETTAEGQVVSIGGWPELTIGQITKEKKADIRNQNNDGSADDEDQDTAGPSTAKKMKM